MSFLFGKTSRTVNDDGKKNEDESIEIGPNQPCNKFKDLLLLPYFNSNVSQICIFKDEKRFVTGDEDGNLMVWDAEFGTKLAEMKYHESPITGIIQVLNIYSDIIQKNVNMLIVSSGDKIISTWNLETYTFIKSIKLTSNVNKIFLNLTNSSTNQSNLIVAGLDLKLYDHDLNQIDEFVRKSRDDSVKFMIIIKDNRIVVATNSDIEIYSIFYAQQQSFKNIMPKIKELRKFIDVHNDSILYLDNLDDNKFGSSSSDGNLIIWQSDTLVKYIELRPFNDIIGINCFKLFKQTYLVICSGQNISIYSFLTNTYVHKVTGAHHNSKITDMVFLKSNIIATSAEDGSIRIWRLQESLLNENNPQLRVKLILIGENLGHSASIMSIKTLTTNEIVSIGYDKMVVLWRDSAVQEIIRSLYMNKILSNVNR